MTPQEKKTSLKEVRKIGEILTSQKAHEMITAWQSQEPDGVFSFLYGRHVFDKILAAPQCEGIRVFNAIYDEEERHALVLIGADAAGKHIFQYQLPTSKGTLYIDDLIMEHGIPCPPFCPPYGNIDLKGLTWSKTGGQPLDLTLAGEPISREEAQEMITAYQSQEPDGVYSFLYGREIFDAILSVPGCAGIRVFNGMNDKNRHTLVFVGVDARGGNILQYHVNTPEGMHIMNAPLADGGHLCPPICGDSPGLGY